MKKRKRIFLTMLTTILTFLGVLLGINNAPKVEAGTTSPYINIRYETYLLEDYKIVPSWETDFFTYFDAFVIGSDITSIGLAKKAAAGTYTINVSDIFDAAVFDLSAAINEANTYWDGKNVDYDSSLFNCGGTGKTPYEFYGGYPFDLFNSSGKNQFSVNVEKKTTKSIISEDDPFTSDIDDVIKKITTTFNPGDEMVIVEYVKGDTEYKDTAICYDLEFLDGTQTLPLTKAKTKAASLPSSFSTTDFYVWENSAYGNKYNTVVNATGTFYDTTGSSIATKSAFKGGGGSSDTSTYTTEDVAFAIGFKIDSGANGNYKIKPASTDESKYIPNISNATGFKFVTNSDHFNITPLTITVAGASNATGLSSITLGGTAATSSTVTNISGTTNGSTSPSGTKPAGSHIGTSNYATFTSTAGSSASSIDLVAAVDGRGTITSVKYGTSASAALTGTTASANAAGTGYTIPLGNAGDKTYAALTVTSNDGTNIETYIIEITKDKFNIAELNGLSFTSDGSITTSTMSPSFSSSTIAYNVKVAGDANNLNVVPTWDSTKFMTVKVNGVVVSTSGSTSTVAIPPSLSPTSSSPYTFDIDVIAQDGVGSLKYTINVTKLSTDTSLDLSLSKVILSNGTVVNLNNSNVTASTSGSTTTYTIPDSLVVYANTTFNLYIASAQSSAKIKIGTGSQTTANASKNGIPFNNTAAASSYGADTITVRVEVTSEAGTVQNYDIIVKKAKANEDAELSLLEAYTSSGNLITLDNAFATTITSYNSSSDVAFNLSGFYVKATATQATSKVTFTYGTNGSTGSPSNSGATFTSATASFSGGNTVTSTNTVTITITAENPAHTKSYTVTVNKAAADDDSSFTVTAVDNLGRPVTGAFTGNTWATTTNILKDADKVEVTFTPNKSTSKVYIGGTLITSPYNVTLQFDQNGVAKITSINVVVKTEANTTTGHAYTLNFTTDPRLTNKQLANKVVEGSVSGDPYSTISGSTTTTLKYELPSSEGGNFNLILTAQAGTMLFYSDDINDLSGTPCLGLIYGSSPLSSYLGTKLIIGADNTTTIPNLTVGTTYYVKVYSEYSAYFNYTSGTTTYTFEVKAADERDTNNIIDNIQISGNSEIAGLGWTFNKSTTSGIVALPDINLSYDTSSITFTVFTENDLSKVYISTSTTNLSSTGGAILSNCQAGNTFTIPSLSTGNNIYYFQCRSEKEVLNPTKYQIKIIRATPSTGDTITSMMINGNNLATIDPINIIKVTSSTVNLAFTVDTNATFSATSQLAGGSTSSPVTTSPLRVSGIVYGSYAKVEILVLSQANASNISLANKYTFYLVYAEDTVNISDISIKGETSGTLLNDITTNSPFTFNPSTTNNTFKIFFSDENPELVVQMASTTLDATITGDGVVTITGSTTDKNQTRNVVIKSQFYTVIESLGLASNLLTPYASQKLTYTFNFVRKGASQDRSVSASFVISGGAKDGQTINITSAATTVENMGAANSINMSVTPTNANAPIKYSYLSSGNISVGTSNVQNVSLPTAAGASQTFTLYIYSESDIAGLTNSPVTYQINLCQGNATLDSDASMRNITVVGTDNITYLAALVPGQTNYNLTIPGNVNGVNITVFPTVNTATSEISVDGAAYQPININTATLFNLTLPTTAPVVTTYEIVNTAQNGTASPIKYKIKITSNPLEAINTISNLKINNVLVSGFVSTNSSCTVNVKNNITQAIADFTLDGSHATIIQNDADASSPLALLVGSNTITIVIQAEDSTQKTYTIFVIRDGETELTDLVVNDPDEDLSAGGSPTNLIASFNPTTFNYPITVPFETDDVVLTATLKDPSNVTMEIKYGSTIVTNGGSITLTAGITTNVTITVTPASGAANATTYQVNITRTAGSTDCDILTFDHDYKKDGTMDSDDVSLVLASNKTTYTYNLPRNAQLNGSFDPEITVSAGATYNLPTDKTLILGLNQKQIEVIAQNGTTKKTYTFNIYVAENDYKINDIKLYNSTKGTEIKDNDNKIQLEFVDSTDTYNITIPYSVTDIHFDLNLDAQYAQINVDGSLYVNNTIIRPNVGTKTYKIQVVSEYGSLYPSALDSKSTEYKIIVERKAASSDASLKALEVLNGTMNYLSPTLNPSSNPSLPLASSSFNPATFNYVVQNIGNTVTSVEIKATANDSNATIVGVGNKALTTLVDASHGYNFSFDVIVTAEDGTNQTYNITLSRGQLNLDDDNSLTKIEVTDSNGQTYITNFNIATLAYNVIIPYGASSFTIAVTKNAISPSTVTIDGTNCTNNSKQIQITPAMIGNSKSYDVYVTSQNGAKGTTYTIDITFENCSTDTSLSVFTIDGVVVTGFDKNTDNQHTTYYYTISSVANTKTSIFVSAIVNDSKSKVTINSMPLNQYNVLLNEGINQIVVLVTAESGDTATYVISVTRSYADPKLTDLAVDGEVLLDLSNKTTTFDRDVNEYNVIVKYMTVQATIKVTVDNVNYIVSITNATCVNQYGSIRTFQTTGLIEGLNKFVITVTSAEGTQTEYKINITRNSSDSTNTNLNIISIKEIADFKNDFNNANNIYDKNNYSYTVPNYVKDLNFNITPEIVSSISGPGATVEVFNNTDLKVGDNKVVVIVTAEDGETTRAIIIDVHRNESAYTIDTEATGYETKPIDVSKNNYFINLGNDYPTDLKPEKIKNYISVDRDSQIDVEILSTITKDTKEIILSLTDGDKVEYVTFELSRNVLNFSVDTNATDYETNVVDSETNVYEINLETSYPSEFTAKKLSKYITYDPDCDYVVNLLTDIDDTSKEAILSVSDGTNTQYVTFKFVRKALSYNVNVNAYEKYTCTLNADGTYTINLGTENVKAISDYKKYITNYSDDTEVIVLSDVSDDNCSEVIIKITNGDSTEYVKFALNMTPPTNYTVGWYVWVAIAGTIILLIVILICVNKDKYGKVSNRRKKAK